MSKDSFRDSILEQEKWTPEFEEKFHKEMKNIMEKKLGRAGKIGWIFSTLLGIFFVVLFSYVALTAPPDFPLLGRIGFITGALFGAGWAILGVWTLKKKSFNLFRQENLAHGLSFGFVLLFLILSMMLGSQMEDKTLAILMTLNGAIFFMVFGIPALFTMRINRTEVGLREELLKLQLKVLEINESIQKKS